MSVRFKKSAAQDTFVRSGGSPPSVPTVLPTLPEALLNTRQVAKLLGVCLKTLQRMVLRREISYIKLSNRSLRFERPAVDVYLARRRVKAVA